MWRSAIVYSTARGPSPSSLCMAHHWFHQGFTVLSVRSRYCIDYVPISQAMATFNTRSRYVSTVNASTTIARHSSVEINYTGVSAWQKREEAKKYASGPVRKCFFSSHVGASVECVLITLEVQQQASLEEYYIAAHNTILMYMHLWNFMQLFI